MKPLFVKRSRAWFAVLVVGIAMVGAGLWQAPNGISTLKGSAGGGAPAAEVRVTPQKMLGDDTVATDPNLRGGNVNEQQNTAVKGSETQGTVSAKQNEFFVQYRLERDRTRSQQIDLFREIVNNQNSPEETRKEAQRRLLAITQVIETEMKLENLIKAENFKDAVVFVQDKSVTVIVEAPLLTPPDKDRLTSITVRATGFSQDNVVIIAKV